jgi:hypothetical protein
MSLLSSSQGSISNSGMYSQPNQTSQLGSSNQSSQLGSSNQSSQLSSSNQSSQLGLSNQSSQLSSSNQSSQLGSSNQTAQNNNSQTENNNILNNNIFNNDIITGLEQGLNITATSIIIGIVLVLLLSLAISITITIFGHKARVKCIGNPKFGVYSPLIITFLILMWLGNIFPPFGFFITFVGLVGTIIMIVLANKNCKIAKMVQK